MGLRIQNNIEAMNAHRNLTQTSGMMSKSLERLSSGYRINKASDDAAGLAISSSFRADIASYKVASRNVAEANAMAQVAEGAYDQISSMLVRIKELATQASSANAGSNLDKINTEGNALIYEIDRIARGTEYAGTKLLDGTFGPTTTGPVEVSAVGTTLTASAGLISVGGLVSDTTYNLDFAYEGSFEWDITASATINSSMVSQTLENVFGDNGQHTINFGDLGLSLTIVEQVLYDYHNDNHGGNPFSATIQSTAATTTTPDFQIGAKNTSNDKINFSLDAVTPEDLGISANQMLSATDAQSFLTDIDAAIDTLNDARGGIGAIQNRLGYASANLATTIENVQAAESVIRDVDMASEMTSFTKSQILMQAGTAMLAQANMAPQGILSLIG